MAIASNLLVLSFAFSTALHCVALQPSMTSLLLRLSIANSTRPAYNPLPACLVLIIHKALCTQSNVATQLRGMHIRESLYGTAVIDTRKNDNDIE